MYDLSSEWQRPESEYVYHILPEYEALKAIVSGGLPTFIDDFACYLFVDQLSEQDGSPVDWHPDHPGIPPKRWNLLDGCERPSDLDEDDILREGWVVAVRVRLEDIQRYAGEYFRPFGPFTPDPDQHSHKFHLYGLVSGLEFDAVNAEFLEFYYPRFVELSTLREAA